jgi:uncharacterized membrane protein
MKPAQSDNDRQGRCSITGAALPERSLIHLDQLQPALAARIRADHPTLDREARISRQEVNRYRLLYVQELLRQERGELSDLDDQVARSLAEGDLLSKNVEDDYAEGRTIGERLADGLANLAGSWAFLTGFAIVLMVWMGFNLVEEPSRVFDPYPFILLNLALSCLAAVQAPVIMMSQKRQEAKDRLRALNDYRVNLKAELEIRHLHEKVDHLISRQWQRLAEIQELQIELMQERR